MDVGVAAIICAIIAAFGSCLTVVLTQRQNRKIDETHRTLTVNHHSSAIPTVLDRLSSLDTKVTALDVDVTLIKKNLDM
jgi:hypothetical protein